MRLAQLHEAQETIESTDELIDLIRRDCKEAIALYKRTNKVFLRGERHPGKAFVSNIRDNRKPLQMKRSQHDAINDAFKILGLEVNRGNAIFCSTSQLIAGSWGSPYVIFPKDGWKGLVFNKVKSGYVFHILHDEIMPKAKIKVPVYPGATRTVPGYDRESIASALQDLEPNQFTAKNGDEVLNSKFEDILIRGPGYYGIYNPNGTAHRDQTDLQHVLSELGLAPRNLGTHWEKDNGEEITVVSWKDKVLKKYPDAKFYGEKNNTMGHENWEARLDDGRFVGVGEFYAKDPLTRKPIGYTQVFTHPRSTDY